MEITELYCDPKLAAIWLSALIDGEGCVWIGKLKSGPAAGEVRRSMSIGMTDKEVIEVAAHCLTTLGVRHNLCRKPARVGRKEVFILSVTGQIGLRKLAEVLTLSHHGKRERLASILSSYKAPSCGSCGVPYDQRTRGCEACQARMKYRRKHGLPNTPGRTGRLPREMEGRL